MTGALRHVSRHQWRWLPDLFVCNDFSSPDRIWINVGDADFRRSAPGSAQYPPVLHGWISPTLDRDGATRFFSLTCSAARTRSDNQIGDVASVFSKMGEIDNRPQYSATRFSSIEATEPTRNRALQPGEASSGRGRRSFWMLIWTGEDLLITTGHELEMMNADVSKRAEAMKAAKKLSIPEQLALRTMFPRLDSPNVAFRNRGDLTFEDRSAEWNFDTKGVSHGMALADLDNDGDLDVAINNLNEAAGIYRNESPAPRVAVRLKGLPANTQGIGAKIKVMGGPVPRQSQEVICGGRYLSGDDPMRVFAAGSVTNRLRIEVTWRNGKRSVVANAEPNRVYEIDEAAAIPVGQASQPAGSGDFQSPVRTPGWKAENQQAESLLCALFEDVSPLLNHTHSEEALTILSGSRCCRGG